MTGEMRPFLLLRAVPSEEVGEQFRRWFREVHLRDVERIPGMAEAQMGMAPGGVLLGVYTFESAEVVQAALASPEAAYARGTWERWAPHLSELVIEMWAPLGPMPIFESIN